MTTLPARPNLDQLRRQAKDALRAARAGSASLPSHTLAQAQLAIAREYGFSSWPKLKLEVQRRAALDSRDPRRVAAFIAGHPAFVLTDLQNWADHSAIAPLNYVASMRCVVAEDLWRDMPGTGRLIQQLIDAGAPVDGRPEDRETPLITAASYGDADVARVLLAAGAALEARSAPDAGGVPSATALTHAAVFGATEVLDLLVAAGAHIDRIVIAAAAGDLSGWDPRAATEHDRLLALIMAADHQRLDVIDRLLETGAPVDAEDREFGRQALRVAAQRGRAQSVRHLLARGADPRHRDAVKDRTALYWCRREAKHIRFPSGHAEVDAMLSAALGRTPRPRRST
ncbi:MAG TPA: ankyrin repeat domain-containing protein [Jatrophihabitans sp.]|nr:ankyrin repeat domain-containing protein [Jatrophihabitans sp.]